MSALSVSNGNPAVSVLMPVYNTARYVGEAIESILSQTFEDFEFIIIDDGSTDESADVVRKYGSQDARIRFVSRENRGCYQTRNEAFSLSRGEFIAPMDSDDVSLPERLSLEVEYLRQNRDCVGVGAWMLLVDPDGMPLGEHRVPLPHREIDRRLLRGEGSALSQGVMMVRRSAYLQVGGYGGKRATCEDLELALRLAEVGTLANIPAILLKYRQHLGSISTKKRDQQHHDALDVTREAHSRRGLAFDLGRQHLPRTAGDENAYIYNWIYSALKSGNTSLARKHAWRILRRFPLRASSWRSFAIALLGKKDSGLGKWLRAIKRVGSPEIRG